MSQDFYLKQKVSKLPYGGNKVYTYEQKCIDFNAAVSAMRQPKAYSSFTYLLSPSIIYRKGQKTGKTSKQKVLK